ncbi:MAG: glycosyltransferase [Chromatiaceae bacterium]|nr:glycosyltransferase [Chromatiaceae bacterium]
MRIVIDMQGAQTESRFRGIGRYTMSFAQAVVRNKGEHEIFLALSGLFPDTIESIRAAFDDLLPQENIRVWYAPGPVKECEPGNDWRRKVAELIREAFLASLAPDVIHLSSLFEGYVDDAVTSIGCFDANTQVSVTLHDLIPLLYPDHYLKPNPRYAHYYQHKIEHLKKSALYLAVSEFSRKESVEHLDISASVIVNTSEGTEPHFKPCQIAVDVAQQLRHKFDITRPFVLYTGGADQRKNLRRLIQAYATLPAPLRAGHQLLLAGKMPQGDIAHLQEQAKSVGLQPDELLFTGYVTDDELVKLYNLCELFVFPSWHEGFGLPALEAMACGAPVIGANTSSLPEVIALDEAMFDPLDVAAIAAKMAHGLENDAFRAKLREHGWQQAQRFSWDESAKRAITAWEDWLKSQPQQKASSQPTERKLRLAFISPLPPERTGIADYSAELLPALAAHYDIEVVVAQDRVDEPWVNRHGTVRDVSWFLANTHAIDRVLYQVGNSPFHQHMLPLLVEIPGVVVLHDFYMSGLMSWLELYAGAEHAWTEALYAAHGYGAVRERYRDPEAAKRKYPVNLQVLQHAQGLIVHSKYSRSLVHQWCGEDFTDAWEMILHLRSPASTFDKAVARKQLGLDENDFVVCSFGFLDSTKLNHRLLNAWLDSALASDKRCKLVFVGENHGGDYGSTILQTIRASGLGNRIHITGFASPETFRLYLMAADMAVQLRANSRGETSGTVLDGMNHALPLIVNANGSIAELNPDAVWMLPNEFADGTLVEALETMWREPERRRAVGERAREIILNQHAPAACAQRYTEAIEHFQRRAETAKPALIQAIAAQNQFVPSDADLRQLAKTLSATLPLLSPAKRLFLDVTATCRNDLKTGIERVARALLLALLEAPPTDYRIEPVYLSEAGRQWHYRYARRYTLELLGCPPDALVDEIVEPECGDILLGLDLSGDMLVQAERAGVFADYRNHGVMVYSVVFDLLPVRIPEVFPPGADLIHATWLQTVANFDGAICISKAVADDLVAWQEEAGFDWKGRRPFRVSWFHLGADVANSAPSLGLPDNAEWMLGQLRSRPSFLMVGTIEPRKGYLQTIEAFTQLWHDDVDVNLVIVGKEGWKDLPDDMRRDIPQTIELLKIHPELDKRLFWLEGISDEYLEKVYAASTCLIAASYGEGFGLPLIEASQHKLPIIARDIPVFREVAGDHAYYFDSQLPAALAQAINKWLDLFGAGQRPTSAAMPWLTWKESAQLLARKITKYQS